MWQEEATGSCTGMGIVSENANFWGSETDSMERENCLREKDIGGTKKRKEEALVLVPHQKPMKLTECVHMWL